MKFYYKVQYNLLLHFSSLQYNRCIFFYVRLIFIFYVNLRMKDFLTNIYMYCLFIIKLYYLSDHNWPIYYYYDSK